MGDRLKNRIALITGGASGIGRGCAERLAGEGAHVVITDIDDVLGAEAVAGIEAAGGSAEYLHHDVTSEDDWVAVIAQVTDRHGALHILVNNAGIGVACSIFEMSLADWQRQQAINLDGVFLGVKHGIPLIRDSGGGSVINISSVAGLKGAPNLSAYNATKGGVRLFTKGVALECAQNRWNVRVNSVHPGIIDTPIWSKADAAPLAGGANQIDVEQMAAAGVPTGELGSPRDIANGVLFLASDESSYMTGSELVIDGGVSA
jgi:NAD(P)-dependent dehydrogenase (short-subunit alcohol dehydrogenase family)